MAKRTSGEIARIPVSNETFKVVRGFKWGAETNYDTVIRRAMSMLIRDGETPYQAGARDLKEWEEKQAQAANDPELLS